MIGEGIKGCAGKAFLLAVVLVAVATVALFVLREGGGAGDGASRVRNGPLRTDQAKRPAGPAELEELQAPAANVRKDSTTLADGSTRVNQVVLWQIDDNEICFRIILTPYDKEAHQMMAMPSEALFLSFETKAGIRIAPKAEPRRIEMRHLRLATDHGEPAGWFMDGKIPLDRKEERAIDVPKVGWLFSKRLHSRLRQLQVVAPAAAGS
jgi:hypothetical protein